MTAIRPSEIRIIRSIIYLVYALFVTFFAIGFAGCGDEAGESSAPPALDATIPDASNDSANGEIKGTLFIRLVSGAFDPLTQWKLLPFDPELYLESYPEKEGAYLVQLNGPITAEMKNGLTKLGVTIQRNIPDFTFLVWMTNRQRDQVEALDYVRWVGIYQPQFRISPTLRQVPEQGPKAPVQLRLTPFPSTRASITRALAQQVTEIGGRVLNQGSNEQLDIQIAHEALPKVARLNTVLWIEPQPVWKLYNDQSRDIMDISLLWSAGGVYGAGQTIAIADTGLDRCECGTCSVANLHDDFENGAGASRVVTVMDIAGDGNCTDTNAHGTHVAGSALGNGDLSGATPSTHSYPTGCFAGLAPEASLVFQSIMRNSDGVLVIPSLSALFSSAYALGARIHSNSWGSTYYDQYTSAAYIADEYMWNNPQFLILFAAGNNGADHNANGFIDLANLDSPGTAKNVLTVGASERYSSPGGYTTYGVGSWAYLFPVMPISGDSVSNNQNGLAAFSSRGPVADGRYKPDVVAPGTNIISARSTAAGAGTGWGVYDSNYLYMGGTSMSTPLVAGLAAVIRDRLADLGDTTPSAALIKALIGNGAVDMAPGQYGVGSSQEIPWNADSRRNMQGLGRANARLGDGTAILYEDITPGLATGENYYRYFEVNSNTYPLRVTVAWTDCPGAETAGGGLVNNLDVSLYYPTAATGYPDNANQRGATYVHSYSAGPFNGMQSSSDQGRAIKVTPTFYPAILDRGLFYFYDTYEELPDYIDVYVYDDDGASGYPGTVLYSATHVPIRQYDSFWYDYDLSPDVTITEGSFYLEVYSEDSSEQYKAPFLRFCNTDVNNHSWDHSGTTWIPRGDREWGIRAVVKHPDTETNFDRVNNLLQIDDDPAAVGRYRLNVSGFNVPGCGAATRQPFAYVISGDIKDGCETADDCDDENPCTTDSCVSHYCEYSNAPSTTLCRDVWDVCDVAEYCTGTSMECPAAAYAPTTTLCRAKNGDCDVAEYCTGTSPYCPTDGAAPTTTGCRFTQGVCDVSDYCDGSNKTCPANAFRPTTFLCRSAQNVCDIPEYCDGSSADCPFQDLWHPPGYVCRASTGVCDPQEVCVDGGPVADYCAPNVLSPSTTECRASAGDCDIAEFCTGSTADCPADVLQSTNHTCRASADVCDVAEKCDGSTAACPADSFLPTSTTCRAKDGLCDVAETCTGSSAACPADAVAPTSTGCRFTQGICDVSDYCDGSNKTCPANAFRPTTFLCRSAQNVCDIPEYCDGSSADCPFQDLWHPPGYVCRASTGVCDPQEVCVDGGPVADYCAPNVLSPSTTECRPAAGDCDPAEFCTGSTADCPADVLQSTSHTCRASADVCDVAEKCDGSTAACPADAKQPTSQVCRAAADICDIADSCDGSNAACPADAKQPTTYECRASGGICDLADYCDGSNAACPADAKQPTTHQCRASAGDCDLADYCDGSNSACPADAKQPTSYECRPAVPGGCDAPEFCNGSANTCPSDVIMGASTICRPAAELCDKEERCTGTANTCPADIPQPNGTICRNVAGICDTVEYCNGTSFSCPADGFTEAGALCRTWAGECDKIEYCTGTSAACPADGFEPSTTVCRSSSGDCDIAEHCTGTGLGCPSDGFAPTTVLCRDSVGECDYKEYCPGNAATCPTDLVMPSATVCRAVQGVCDIAEACPGDSPYCPDDLYLNGIECRPAAGICDEAETCNGNSPDCPTNSFAWSGKMCQAAAGVCDYDDYCSGTSNECVPQYKSSAASCREAADVCDIAENCTGSTADCPGDAFFPSSTVCRDAAHPVCDPAENCTGSTAACPDDAQAPNGTGCNDNNDCTTSDICTDGACDGTLNPAPFLELLYPSTYQQIAGGSHRFITWDYGDCPLGFYGSVKISASIDGGASYPIMIDANAPDNGSYSWNVPLIDQSAVRIKIEAGTGHDESQDNLRIYMPTNFYAGWNSMDGEVKLTWAGGNADIYTHEGQFFDSANPSDWTAVATNVSSPWVHVGSDTIDHIYYRILNAGTGGVAPRIVGKTTFNLSYGYTLLAVPFELDTPLTAQNLLDIVNADGLHATTLIRWDGSTQYWDIHYASFPTYNDFELESGVGYFMEIVNPTVLRSIGTIVQEPLIMSMGYDFFLLGFPTGEWLTAQEVLDDIILQGGAASTLYRWLSDSQMWDVHYQIYPGFNNFDIWTSEGYFVKNDLPVDFMYNPLNITESDVTATGFTVSWATTFPSTGWLLYGADPDAVTTMAAGDWSTIFSAATNKSVTVSGLTAGTYYYDIMISGTVYDNLGEHYQITLP